MSKLITVKLKDLSCKYDHLEEPLSGIQKKREFHLYILKIKYREYDIEDLKKSLMNRGYIHNSGNPIRVLKWFSNKFKVIGGNHRTHLLKHSLGEDTEIKVYRMSYLTLVLKMIIPICLLPLFVLFAIIHRVIGLYKTIKILIR
tara:strand:- start:768 stop:1199 length:432 start_codon:yes stop_codon:yes gene_type:complete